MHPRIRKILAAVFTGHSQDSPSQPIPEQSPAPSAEKETPDEYIDVCRADAIAELSYRTGDPQTDGIHAALIDCVQSGYLKTVRGKDDGLLRFGVTSAGKARIQEYLNEMEYDIRRHGDGTSS
jgi:hypothetical protein